MAEEVVEFADNVSLVEELVSRETFPGVVVFLHGYRNNQGQGRTPTKIPRVEIANGVSNQEAAELLREVQKALLQFVANTNQGC